MAKTDRDVVERALQILTVAVPGESVDPNDYNSAREEYTATHKWIMMKLRNTESGRGAWAIGSVPEEVFPHVARILADDLVAGNVFKVDEYIPTGDRSLAFMTFINSRRKKQIKRYPAMPTSRRW